MVVAVAELDVELDAAEERRRRVEDDRVGARLEPGAKLAIRPSASVVPDPTSAPSR